MNLASQRHAARLTGLVLLVAMLGACLSEKPSYIAPPLAMPAQWQQGSASVSMLEGFALFQEESLTRLQQRALASNQDLQVAMLRLAQSRLQRSAVALQSQPQVAASGSAGAQRQSEIGSATRLISAISPPDQSRHLIDFISEPYELFQAGFDASWELDLWGRVSNSVDAADARVAMAEATVAQWQLGLMAEVARHYFELRGTQNQVLLLRQDVARNDTILRLLQAREHAGLDNALERAEQEALLTDLRRREAVLQEQQSRSFNALSLLLGEVPGSLESELSARQPWTMTALPDLALGVPSDVVNTRPDIQASEARLREATAHIGIAQADLYPRITLGAGLGLETLESAELLDWGSRQWSVGPRFSLPLFDQGRRKTTVQLRELQQQEAAIAYQQVVLNAWHEVENALARYGAERQQRTELLAKLAHQEQTLRLARANVRNGLSNALVALKLEQAVANVQNQLSQSDTRQALNMVVLFKALGRTHINNL